MHKKVKIVFIINNFLVGGVERLFLDIISFINRDKYDIKIVTVLGSGPLESSFRELGIPIYFAGNQGSSSKKLPFKLYWILIAPVTLIRITFFLLKSKPDVVITSLYQADVLGMIASKILRVKKRILIQHDIVKFGLLIRIVKKIFAINFATQIISISETVKGFLVDYFEVKSWKIITIYNGINYELFEKGRKLIPDFNSPVIGVVGRLENVKGHIYLLEALKILKEKYNIYPNTLIAGDGSLRNDLEKYVKNNSINNIKFLGNVNNVPDFLLQIDILIIPSVEEGFGLVVLEGMVSGKVIITSDIEVMHELIENGLNGLLFKSKDSNSLAKIILSVLKDKDVCKRLQDNTILFMKENKNVFDIHKISETYQNLFIN